MRDNFDSKDTPRSRDAVPPLPAALRQRTLAMARTNLRMGLSERRVWKLADYTPPLALVPSVLLSAGAAFVVDALIKVVRFFWIS
jgi:hypothetical protein